MNRKAVFDAVRRMLGRGFRSSEVTELDLALDQAFDKTTAQFAREAGGGLRMSHKGIALIKEFETCKLTAYLCPAKVWTIGWGTTRINGKPVTPGLRITQDIADKLFVEDLARYEADVRQLIGAAFTTQGQFDALVSFAYNAGPDIDADTIAEGLGDSTLLKKHLRGDYAGAAAEFAKWKHGGGRVLKGLIRRREAEKALYLS